MVNKVWSECEFSNTQQSSHGAYHLEPPEVFGDVLRFFKVFPWLRRHGDMFTKTDKRHGVSQG